MNLIRTATYTLLILCLLGAASVSAQFTVLKSGVDADLHCIQFLIGGHGYAAGANGVIVGSEDNGRHWSLITAETRETINDLYFLNPDFGYIVGENGVFKRTVDGGATWQNVEEIYSADYTDIHFTDSLIGFAIGHNIEGGVFCKTTDGGKSWTSQYVKQDCERSGMFTKMECDDLYLMEMEFLDDQHGLIAGFTYNFAYGKHPFICKTEDGGKTFKDISPTANKNDWYDGKEVVSINYMNDHDACAVMNTGNGTDFMFLSDYDIQMFEKNNLSSNFKAQSRLFSSEFLGRFIGYFTGIINGEPQIIKTIDQGNTFMFLNPPTNNTLYAAHFQDQNNGYFVGENGTILHLSDRSNIVYAANNPHGEADVDPPFSVASVKRKNKLMQVHIYNLQRTNAKNFSISLQDSQGRAVPVKPRRIRIYSDEIRIWVRIKDLAPSTYFYTVSYSNRTVINGKLNMANYAHIGP